MSSIIKAYLPLTALNSKKKVLATFDWGLQEFGLPTKDFCGYLKFLKRKDVTEIPANPFSDDQETNHLDELHMKVS